MSETADIRLSDKWKELRAIAFWVALGGLMVWFYQLASTSIEAKRSNTGSNLAAMKAKVTTTVSQGPKTSIWATQHGDVIELLIPTSVAGLMVEYKRCFVFRDAVTHTSTISCEMAAGNGDLSAPDGPDYSDLR